jgi:hypothetical protein
MAGLARHLTAPSTSLDMPCVFARDTVLPISFSSQNFKYLWLEFKASIGGIVREFCRAHRVSWRYRKKVF